ncbi:MAG: hypothetical protein JO163_15085 [Methylobacteriaceae bacterium]|nr:hypothetical protein [Methylobacteriaceae bacterium]
MNQSSKPASSLLARLPKFLLPKKAETLKSNGAELASELRPIVYDPLISSQTIEGLGRGNEQIRNHCLDIVHKVTSLATINDDLVAVFDHVGSVLSDFELTKAELMQRNVALQTEQEAHAALRTRVYALQQEHDRIKAENAALAPELQRVSELMRAAEQRIEEIEAESTRLGTAASSFEQALHGKSSELAYRTDELESLRRHIQTSDATISGLETELAAQRLRYAVAEEDIRVLQGRLTEAQANVGRLETALKQCQIELESEQQRRTSVESDLQTHRLEHGRARDLWHGESEARAKEIIELQSRHDTAASRLEAANRLHANVSEELRGKSEELRQEQRRTLEGLVNSGVLEKKLEASLASLEELTATVARREASQKALADRVKPFLKAFKAKKADVRQLQQETERLRAALETTIEEGKIHRDALERTARDLAEKLEKEKVLRSIAEGALQVDRQERSQLRSALETAQRALSPNAPEPPRPAPGPLKGPKSRVTRFKP